MSYYGKTLGFFRTAGYDSDAAAFFTNAGITDSGEKGLWNDFVLGCKSDLIYSKIKTFHPMLGSSLTAKRYNAIDTALSMLSNNGVSNTDGVLYNLDIASFSVSGLSANNSGFGFMISVVEQLVGTEQDRGLCNNNGGISIGQYNDSIGDYYIGYSWQSNYLEEFHTSRYISLQSTVESGTPYTRGYGDSTYLVGNTTNTEAIANMYFGDISNYGQDLIFNFHYTSEGLTTANHSLLKSRINTLMTGLGR